jgi:P27 family predicted phage terminase small subunit
MRGRKPKVAPDRPAQLSDGMEIEIPTRPKSLMNKAHGLMEWKRIITELHKKGLFTRNDLKMVELYCNAAQDYADRDQDLREHGGLVPDKGGGLKSNPAARMKRDAADQMSRYLSEMGLTAVSAMRLGAESPDPDDEFDQLLNRRTDD